MLSMPPLQDGIGLANQKARCDQLLMSVCREGNGLRAHAIDGLFYP